MSLRSTFPIPKQVLASELGKRMARMPATWLPLLGIAIGGLLGSVLGGGIILATLIASGLYWKARWPRLRASVIEDWVEEHNDDQNDALYRTVKLLDKYKCDDLADTLKRFLRLKKAIEGGLHDSGELTAEKEEMETLVDSLCFEVADELRRVSDIRYSLKKDRKRKRLSQETATSLRESEDQLMERVAHAEQTLSEMHTHLDTILNPLTPSLAASANPALDETIAKLKEETTIARRVRQRIETDYAAEIEMAAPARQATLE